MPLNLMIKDDKVTMAQYALDNGMIDTEGWRGLRKLAKKDNLR